MNHKDMTKAFSVIMAAAIVSSLGMITQVNSIPGSTPSGNSITTSSPSDYSLETILAAGELKK